MEPAAIYKQPRFLELADMIENHKLAIESLGKTLGEEFPAPAGFYWTVLNNRPMLASQWGSTGPATFD